VREAKWAAAEQRRRERDAVWVIRAQRLDQFLSRMWEFVSPAARRRGQEMRAAEARAAMERAEAERIAALEQEVATRQAALEREAAEQAVVAAREAAAARKANRAAKLARFIRPVRGLISRIKPGGTP
jgi:Na+-translocating ferredoxin:NAD+ oxidoreductase RnfC subunit